MDALQIANSLPMWIACGVAVILVIAQALIFIKKAIDAAPEVGVTKEQVNKAIKSSALTSIGPSIVVLSGMLSLLVTVGGPMGWMRLSFIGSVMFESIAAGIGTGSVGVQLGVDELTPLALTMAVWTMILGSVGWIIFSTFAADKMDKIQGVTVADAPDGYRWKSEKEICFSSGYVFADNPDFINGLLQGESQLSALVIKRGRYLEEIPEYIV